MASTQAPRRVLPDRWPTGTKIVGAIGGGRFRRSARHILRDALTGNDVANEVARLYSGRFGAVDVRVNRVGLLHRRLNVAASLSLGSRRIGGIRRRLGVGGDGKLVAEHAWRFGRVRPWPLKSHDATGLDPFVAAYEQKLADWYRASGVARVENHATGDASHYWALRGDYDWRDGLPDELLDRIRLFADSARPIRRTEARALLARIEAGENVTPYRVASLTSGADLLAGIGWVGVRDLAGGV